MLCEPERHEPLLQTQWDESRVRDSIRSLAGDMQDHLRPGIGWAAHPLDEIEEPKTGVKSLYLGAAGALWALWYLAREGAADLRFDPAALVESLPSAYLAEPDTGEAVPSYLLGEVGILLVAWRLKAAPTTADRLWEAIRANIANPTNESLWAAPGTMVGAWHMWTWTGEARWRDLFAQNVEQLWRTWLPSEHAPCHMWTQDLYGRIVQLMGAGHGFAGNVYPLLLGAPLLSGDRRNLLYERCVEALRATALFEDECANWPPGLGPPRPGRASALVQWCHGAPGMVTGLAHFPLDTSLEMEGMLRKAGNAVWRAGPLVKGYGLCHGTAGNGYAFLELHRRSGDPIWLERARAFAMHALAQQERMRQQYGRGRYTLWTGDPGLTVYLWHCVVGAGGLPGLDVLD